MKYLFSKRHNNNNNISKIKMKNEKQNDIDDKYELFIFTVHRTEVYLF